MLQRSHLSTIAKISTLAGGVLLTGLAACSSDSSGTKNNSQPDADTSGTATGSGGSTLPTGMGGARSGGALGSAGAPGSGGASGSGGAVGSGGASGSGGSGAGGSSMGMDGPRSSDVTPNSGDAPRAGDGSGAPATGMMSFFVSSKPGGNGGNLGGVAGADKACDDMAKAVGAKRTKWVAYLSAADDGKGMAVNAKDRIGKGPWYNQKGMLFAESIEKLHPTVSATMRAAYLLVKPADELFLDEKGAKVPGNNHDILTGSKPDGTLLATSTCENWTSADMGKKAMLGHSDTPSNTQFSVSWNSAHESGGCTPASLVATGGNGRIYCFATD